MVVYSSEQPVNPVVESLERKIDKIIQEHKVMRAWLCDLCYNYDEIHIPKEDRRELEELLMSTSKL